ncbi:MAG: hypothetical protein WBF33_16825 [Candidatus Nitrosopolaris sp.]
MKKRSVSIMVALAVMMGCTVIVMPTVTTVRGQNVTFSFSFPVQSQSLAQSLGVRLDIPCPI